jgi:hypothetical protein
VVVEEPAAVARGVATVVVTEESAEDSAQRDAVAAAVVIAPAVVGATAVAVPVMQVRGRAADADQAQRDGRNDDEQVPPDTCSINPWT